MKPFDKPPMSSVSFRGGDGSSPDEAIVIEGARDSTVGVAAEYQHLTTLLGEPGRDFVFLSQSLQQLDDGRSFDVLEVRLADGEARSIYFDISAFFGRR